jgi:hypothetical protein
VLVGFVGNDTLFQLALAGACLRRQDVAGGGVMAHNLAGSGLLEAFRRTLMGLHLRHILSWKFVRMATKSPVRNYSIKHSMALKNAALPRERADRTDIGDAKREEILVVVADNVVNAAEFKTKSAAISVVAGLILAKCYLVMEEVIKDLRGDVKALAVRTAVAGSKITLVREGEKLLWIGQELAAAVKLVGGDRRFTDVQNVF